MTGFQYGVETMDIKWGREIPVAGVRPAWLADDVRMRWHSTRGWPTWPVAESNPLDSILPWGRGSANWPHASAISLPADHFAYAALDAGFEPWGGGDAAPGDSDGGDVLLRNGHSNGGFVSWWTHNEQYDGAYDIIGYRKRVAPTTLVTVPQMTETEARRRWHPAETRIVILRDLNLIRPETPIERFEAANPGVVNTGNRAAVEAALAWERGL